MNILTVGVTMTMMEIRTCIFVKSNVIQTINNETTHLIIGCLNCSQLDKNVASKMILSQDTMSLCLLFEQFLGARVHFHGLEFIYALEFNALEFIVQIKVAKF